MRLTDIIVRGLPAPERGNKVTYDDAVKGFGARVTANGARSFVLNYRAAGIERRITIGSYPDWHTTEAREEARLLKQEIDRGGDPALERRQRRAAPTVADLVERYRAEHLPRKRDSSRIRDEGMLRRFVIPELGNRKVADIKRADIEQLHRKVTAQGIPVTANRLLILLSKMFTLTIGWEWRADNPASRIERNHEESRHRYLSNDEIAALFKALDDLASIPSANAIKLLLLTGARLREVLSATWDQFDEIVWIKPSSHTKQKRLHRVPLSDAAQKVLGDIKEKSRRSRFLFPSYGSAGHLTNIRAVWYAACRAAGIRDARMHDLRHTYASMLASAGQSLPTIGALLGHSQAATTQRYSHLIDSALREATEIVGRAVTREKSHT